jgi:acyl carrier protein
MNRMTDDDICEIIKQQLQKIVQTNSVFRTDDNSAPLGLDSLKIIQLLVHLEQTFYLEFEDEEMLSEHFYSISSIQTMIKNKLGHID